jgi:hypothetical protein
MFKWTLIVCFRPLHRLLYNNVQVKCHATNSMEQSTPWEVDTCSVDQEIHHVLWNTKIHNNPSQVIFQVLTAVSMNMTAFWDTAPCSLVEVDRRFRGAYSLHYQGDEWWVIALMMKAVRTSETRSTSAKQRSVPRRLSFSAFHKIVSWQPYKSSPHNHTLFPYEPS